MNTLLATIEAWIDARIDARIENRGDSSEELTRALAKLEELEDQLTLLDSRVDDLEDGPGLTRAIEDVIRNNVTVNIDVI
jgi:hypothetical protein